MSVVLPNFIVLSKFRSDIGHAHYKSDNTIFLGEPNVFSKLVKVAVEPATSHSKYVHLRFVYNNGYWAKNANNSFLNVESKHPVEDIENPACTLFKVIVDPNWNQTITLVHVQSGELVRADSASMAFNVNTLYGDYLTYVDWESLVKLPAHVAFQGDNGKYLRATIFNGASLLQFASSDPNEKASGHQVSLLNNGSVQIASDLYSKMWWSGEWSGEPGRTWVYGDWSDSWPVETSVFTPVKIDNSTIALRSNGKYGSNNFCCSISEDPRNDCLAPRTSTITIGARLKVQELVRERTIYDAVYDLASARIYNETPFVAGKSVLINDSDSEATMAVQITYQNEVSYTFSRSLSLTAGVKTNFEVDVPLIEKAQVEISLDISGTLEWDTTTTTTTSLVASGAVPVPAKTSAVIEYVGTTGTCDVPYSYKQKDVLSTDGSFVITKQSDGIYTGVNSYNFNFHVASTTPIAAA